MDQVDSLLSKKRNGEIMGLVFGVPFAISESFAKTDFSLDYPGLYNVTILQRLFAEGALLFCTTGKSSDCLTNESKRHSHVVDQDIGKHCQVSLAVSYGLTPLGLAGNSNSEWIRQTFRAGVFTFVPSRSMVPYTGLSIEKSTNKRLVFFARNLKDMCLFCQVCSGDDGHDEILLRTFKKRLLVDQNFLKVFKPRVLFLNEKLNSNNSQKSDSDWISHNVMRDYFYIDCVEFSEFLDVDELITALYNIENAELEERSPESKLLFGRKYDKLRFETLISDFFDTVDVIILQFYDLETTENNFEYKLLKLFYFFGFPIVGAPLDFTGGKKTKPMLFFIGCKKRDDKLVSVVNYYLKIL
ncbi:MAG: hypothetical protein CMK52_05745 [Proteobacteria bacterium]|nr:hypothetical protein [Pseudomonadota bacterium]